MRLTLADAEPFRDAHGNIDWHNYRLVKGVHGFLHPSEIALLVELATDRDVLEIGAFCGLSAWAMAHTAKHVVSVDTFKADTGGQAQQSEFTTIAEYDRVAGCLDNVSRVPVSSERAIELIPGDFDFIFLDAMHTYPEVLADIQRWWPRVRTGGAMALHDYKHDSFPGVQQAADEVFGSLDDRSHIVTLRTVHKGEDGKAWRAVAEDGSLWSSIGRMREFGLYQFGTVGKPLGGGE